MMSQALNQIDARYLEEAEEFHSCRNLKCIGKIKWIAAAACLALLVVIGKPVLNYATGDSVNSYFEGETEPYMEEILSHVTSVSNEELELRVEGMIADEHRCYMIISFIGLSDEMKTRLLKGDLEEQDLFQTHAVLANGEHIEVLSSGSNTYVMNTIEGRKAVSMIPDAHATYIITYQFEKNVSEIEKIGFSFEDLSVEVDANDYLVPTYGLMTEDGNGKLSDAYVSCISFRFTYHFNAPLTEEDVNDMNVHCDIRMIRADGTILTREEMGVEVGYSMTGGYQAGDIETRMDGCWEKGHLPEILDLEKYCGIQVNGVNYYFVTE